MANTPRRKSDAARRANQIIRTRTFLLMIVLGIITFLLLFWKLYDLQINQHDKLQTDAVKQQTRSTVVTASRGTIYDRNGTPLAISATAETVFISPKDISDHAEEQDAGIQRHRGGLLHKELHEPAAKEEIQQHQGEGNAPYQL